MIKKYSKITEQEYQQWRSEHEEQIKQVNEDPSRFSYHLMAPVGWVNDPNGLHEKDGEYRIYYQYDPFDARGELKLWGLYTTHDFVHYRDCGPVLFPDSDYDAHGVYSGSAFVKGDEIHYFYTGNIKYFDKKDYDYINSGRGSNTLTVTSKNGRVMSEKKLLMTHTDYPSDMSCHVRDPKVFEHDGKYYMVLGARDIEGKGLVLLYESEDLENWKYKNRITTVEKFGYMWECPDMFELNGEWYLTNCPQGVPSEGVNYANVHQSCWMKLDANFENNRFEVKEIHQLDRGTDFYAQQSFEDENGRRIMIGWFGIPDADYTNPTEGNNWQHALTLPRVLKAENGKLVQQPIEEIKQLRHNRRSYNCLNEVNESLLTYECDLDFTACHDFAMTLREGLELVYQNSLLTLKFYADGYGRKERSLVCNELKSLQIYMDTTGVEIFVNGGEDTFTSRFYGMTGKLAFTGNAEGTADIYEMKHFMIQDESVKGLCAIGEALIDFVPDVKGVALKEVPSFHRAAGGAPANVAGAVSKLGIPSRFITKLGKDAFGDYIIDTLNNSGIDTTSIIQDERYETSLAFVSLKEDGNRDFAFYRKNSADLHYCPEEIPENVLDDCGMIHFCSVDLVESSMKQAHRKLIEMAREKGVTICFDPNLRLSLWNNEDALRSTVREFLPLADIVKISDEELEFITGKSDIDDALPFLLQGNTKCVVYTMGKDGACVFTENCSAFRKGYTVNAVDTTGAGDSFIGAFEYCLLKDGVHDLTKLKREQMEQYLDFANAYAAYTTIKQGALSSMADAQQMREWMKKLNH